MPGRRLPVADGFAGFRRRFSSRRARGGWVSAMAGGDWGSGRRNSGGERAAVQTLREVR